MRQPKTKAILKTPRMEYFYFQNSVSGKSRHFIEIWRIYQICGVDNIGVVSCTSSAVTLIQEGTEVKLRAFLTFTLEAVEWLASHCGHLNQVGWDVIESAKWSENSDEGRKFAHTSKRILVNKIRLLAKGTRHLCLLLSMGARHIKLNFCWWILSLKRKNCGSLHAEIIRHSVPSVL